MTDRIEQLARKIDPQAFEAQVDPSAFGMSAAEYNSIGMSMSTLRQEAARTEARLIELKQLIVQTRR